MKIPGIEIWIQHMTNPLVLVGFGIMIFALVLWYMRKVKNIIAEKGIIFLFVLVFVAEIIGIIYMITNAPEKQQVMQQSQGNGSPNILGAKNVNINYASLPGPSAVAKVQRALGETSAPHKDLKNGSIIQNSSATQSPNIIGSDSVHISY